ncbi:MAG TPA: 16S rRNA (adenine(1518)-N(6)/adenine(1519)-N(6))-dimethyltransferase RsmA [Gammaproteobacteria bacterium]|nr:16S rRNA (adenine(1518)-N(6)/adenine(1519)-N(6))-dimethyltransferase RsmA [Gammaproteobacteria bacterium]
MSFKHRARKRFGQNFLVDSNIIDRMARAIAPQPNDRLIEIGPGLGALTRPLLQAAGRLEAVELDRDLLQELDERCHGVGQLIVHQGDALRFDFAALRQDERLLRIVGNLPYNISTPLIFHLLESAAVIADMHFTLQKEVVDRLAAAPASEAYGRLSVMVQYHCRVDRLFDIAPGAFRPIPRVDSGFVRLVPHREKPIEVPDVALLSRLVAQAFSQRRKTLRNSLKGLLNEEQIRAAGIEPALRPEQLDLAGFAALTHQLPQPA